MNPIYIEYFLVERLVIGMLDKYAKAVVGALAAGAGAWGTAASDGSITATEWSGVVVTLLLSLGLVWGVPNEPAAPVVVAVPPPPLR